MNIGILLSEEETYWDDLDDAIQQDCIVDIESLDSRDSLSIATCGYEEYMSISLDIATDFYFEVIDTTRKLMRYVYNQQGVEFLYRLCHTLDTYMLANIEAWRCDMPSDIRLEKAFRALDKRLGARKVRTTYIDKGLIVPLREEVHV